jgi:hypothetical protein
MFVLHVNLTLLNLLGPYLFFSFQFLCYIRYFTLFLCNVSTGALDMHVNHDNGVQHLTRLENYIFEGEKQKKNNL